ncbi:MAG TPA: hypothetical protein VL156_08040 [Terriglobales bacterium]|jgi:ribosome-binding protein aMBF1 (putative translation factor)|nr:hypothetical protein [Terriglobales bacterium]
MPKGRSTFNKRQKEQSRQQKQRDKAERRSLRKQEKQNMAVDDANELVENAKAQAALFNFGAEEPVAPPPLGSIHRKEAGN